MLLLYKIPTDFFQPINTKDRSELHDLYSNIQYRSCFAILTYSGIFITIIIAFLIYLITWDKYPYLLRVTIFLCSTLLFLGTCISNYINQKNNRILNPKIEKSINRFSSGVFIKPIQNPYLRMFTPLKILGRHSRIVPY